MGPILFVFAAVGLVESIGPRRIAFVYYAAIRKLLGVSVFLGMIAAGIFGVISLLVSISGLFTGYSTLSIDFFVGMVIPIGALAIGAVAAYLGLRFRRAILGHRC